MAGVAVLALVAVVALIQRDGSNVTQVTGERTEPAAGVGFFWDTGERPESLVDLDDIRSGGPPPDGIPPIDEPTFVTAAQADWLEAREPVVSLVRNGVARAYPLQILTWHEIVNDVIGDQPVTVTFCPLCNSAIAFERRVPATPAARRLLGTSEPVLDFGTSGRLYRSNLVMYDRQTKSLWIQFTGQSIVGPFIRTQLELIPIQIVSWEEIRAAHPGVQVLSRDTGHARDYGRNPYSGYDDVDASPFLFDGPDDSRLKPMQRVVTVSDGGDEVAFRLDDLTRRKVIHTKVGGARVVVFHKPGTASALDRSSIAESKDVGATGVFRPVHEGRELTFSAKGAGFEDAETVSQWNILGEAVGGPLKGARLEGVVHDDTFWFVWAAFRPDTRIWTP